MNVLLLAVSLFLLGAGDASCQGLRMLYMVQAGYQPREIQERTEEYRQDTGREVKLSFATYEEVYGLIHASAAAGIADFDVVLADLIWMDEYVAHGMLVPVPDRLAADISSKTVEEIHRPFRKDGRFWAYPFLANIQLLYVNREILSRAGYRAPPETMEDLAEMARAAKKAGLVKYPLFDSWNRQEVLVCEFTLMTGAFGGSLTDGGGKPKVDGPACLQALRFMVSLLQEGLMNPYSLQSNEVFAADAFLSGDVLFETNWTFVTGRIPRVEAGGNRLQAALIPVSRSVKPSAVTSTVSGYQGLAVPANSARKEEAWRFIEYLAAPAFQRRHLTEMSVWKEVWDEPRTLQIDPDIGLKKAQIAGVHDRPGHPQYRALSLILQEAVFAALRGTVAPEKALADAQARIEALP